MRGAGGCVDGRSGVRVLIVDRTPSFRCLARELLARRGYTVVGEADCAADAIDAIERLGPDAVLLSVQLPDRNGYELAADLNDAHPALAVVLVSTEHEHDRDHACMRRRSGGATRFSERLKPLRESWPSAARTPRR